MHKEDAHASSLKIPVLQPADGEWDRSKTSRKIISASVGALVISVVVTPLDVVKVRLQSQSNRSASVQSMASTGLSPLMRMPRSVEALVYCNRLFDRVEPIQYRSAMTAIPLPLQSMPRSTPFSGAFEGIMYILRNEGVSSLWRGLLPTLMMSVPATILYFVGYEYLRQHSIWLWHCHQSSLWNDMSQLVAPLCSGAFARTLSVTCISPIELMRTRMQSISHQRQSVSVIKDTAQMIRRDGVLSLWRGLFPTLWRDVPFSAIYWLGYEKSKAFLLRHRSYGGDSLAQKHSFSHDFIVSFTAGCASGMTAAFLTTPFDVAKTRRQIQGLAAATTAVPHANTAFHSTERSMLRILGLIIAEDGWRGLFKGLSARMVKVAPACGIMISSYEVGKEFFGDR